MMPGPLNTTEAADDRTPGPPPQGLDPVPVHLQAVEGFLDPNHLLIRIDEQLDFGKLVAPLEDCYCPDFGRLAIHPEVMVRALLICSLYNIASFRTLCSAISENTAYRWFCFLTTDDPVFDHSSISHFIDRIGRDGFAAIFDGLNEELLRLGMLSPDQRRHPLENGQRQQNDPGVLLRHVAGRGLNPFLETRRLLISPRL